MEKICFFFTKDVKIQKLWNPELGSQEENNVGIFIISGFQQRVRQNSENINNDKFFRLLVTSAPWTIVQKKILMLAF